MTVEPIGMLEFEEVSEIEESNYQETIDFIRSVVDNDEETNPNDLKLAVDTLRNKFGISLTTKYLKNMISADRYRHRTAVVNKCLKDGDIKTRIVNTHTKQHKCIPYKKNVEIYGYNKIDKPIVKQSKSVFFGKFSIKSHVESMKKLISDEEYSNIISIINRNKRMMMERDTNVSYFDYTLTKRQEKAISKRSRGEIRISCKNCKRFVYFHTCPNLDTDKSEKLTSGIYQIKIRNMEEGKELCGICSPKKEISNDKWNMELINEFLTELKESKKCIKISIENICNAFRYDRKKVSPGYIRNILIENSDNVTVKAEKDFIKIGYLTN